ncbi:sugar ABC transporter substrate-binding protein [Eggerthia catenaformis]|uniref:sugar ABC transporter substrate-binding protein n=1 Tax=Eggerthia catenaformis TaxID=31973 RepID=UPI00248EE456|nr:sugar ABC transporter substrate-binding protein [Eggerthia catenaformis]
MNIKKYTIIFWSILSFIIVSIIFGCYRYLPVFSKQYKIGATYMTMNNSFYTALNEQVVKKVSENSDILYTRDPALDSARQAKQIRELVDEGIDGLIINPVDGNDKQINAAVDYAKKKHIKIVIVDSQLYKNDSPDTTILSNNYDAGVLCAKDMMKEVKSAHILLLEHRSAYSAVDRIRGFEDTIKGNKNYHIAARADCLGQTELAMPKVQEVIKKGISFNVIMALNDPSALGALASLENNNLHHKVYVYGVDGSPDVKRLLKETSYVQATAAQSPLTMGQKAIESIYKLLASKKVSRQIIVPVSLITRKIINDYDISGWQ